jgi:hypothetical protein
MLRGPFRNGLSLSDQHLSPAPCWFVWWVRATLQMLSEARLARQMLGHLLLVGDTVRAALCELRAGAHDSSSGQ